MGVGHDRGLGHLAFSPVWPGAGAARDLANLAGVTTSLDGGGFTGAGYAVSFGIGAMILALNIFTTWNYGGNARGIKMYEWFLRCMIGLVIVSFATVVIATGVNWSELFKGFFLFQMPTADSSVTVVLGAIGAAVGINMTFLYPYSLLAKGWGTPQDAVALGSGDVDVSAVCAGDVAGDHCDGQHHLRGRHDGSGQVGSQAGRRGTALVPVMGSSLGRIIFDLGFIGMTCGAISAHMVVCGFTVCEMFGLQYTTARYRMFTLVPAVGFFGVVTATPLWMPVAASAICLTMLPLAYIVFFIMNNKRSYIGDAVGFGVKRWALNLVLLIAIAMATVGAAIKLKSGVWDKIPQLLDKPSASGPALPAPLPQQETASSA